MKTDRTIEEIAGKCEQMIYQAQINMVKALEILKNEFKTWLKGEPSIEDLRRERPWKDVDVGEVVRYYCVFSSSSSDQWLEFTESLSPLGLEFARVVQWLNGKFTGGKWWYAHLEADTIIFINQTYPRCHRLHIAKDEATIKKAVEIFTEDNVRKMLGVK